VALRRGLFLAYTVRREGDPPRASTPHPSATTLADEIGYHLADEIRHGDDRSGTCPDAMAG
jgi:hypothetical protein